MRGCRAAGNFKSVCSFQERVQLQRQMLRSQGLRCSQLIGERLELATAILPTLL